MFPSCSLRIRLAALAFAGIAVFGAALTVWQREEQTQAKQLLASVAKERTETFRFMVTSNSKQFQTIVDEWTYWDDLVDFIKRPTKAWAIENFDSVHKKACIEISTVFDSKWKERYTYGDEYKIKEVLSDSDFKFLQTSINRTNHFAAFYTMRPDGLFEVRAASVHPSNDVERKTPPKGYLVMARHMDGTILRELAELSGGKTSIKAPNYVSPASFVDGYEVIAPALGTDGKVVAQIVFKVDSDAVSRAAAKAKASSAWFIGLVAIIGATLALAISRWIVSPISLLTTAMRTEDPSIIYKTSQKQDEIGILARAIIDKQNQREQMEALNEELTALNEELTALNEEVSQVNEELQRSNDGLAELNGELEVRVDDRTKELQRAIENTILGWSKAMESRDFETEGHSQRVAQMAHRLGKRLQLSETALRDLHYGALLHDIGKIGIPDSILLKEGKLTDAEFELMKEHCEMGHEMLRGISFLEDSLDVPLCHHEKFDGSGYPRGLKGDEIPFAARVFAVADVWDALRSDRPYRAAWSEDETRKYIAEQAGTHFDPEVVKEFLAMEPMRHPSDAKFASDDRAA